jgi:hypothetical protein
VRLPTGPLLHSGDLFINLGLCGVMRRVGTLSTIDIASHAMLLPSLFIF